MENINDYMPLSSDLNKERLETLKKLFPDLFTNEGKLNIDELKKVVDPKSVSETERYEFRWFGKSQAKRNAFTPSNATLVYDEHRSINPTESENLIIEGENLEVLKLLSGSYREKVKCIYIDPPYDSKADYRTKITLPGFDVEQKPTVVEQFAYSDTWSAELGGEPVKGTLAYLKYLYPRLLLMRELLSDTGSIYIHIDWHVGHYLKIILDDIFGRENYVNAVTWKRSDAHSDIGQGSKHLGRICAVSYTHLTLPTNREV